MARALEAAGVSPAVTVREPDGAAATGIEVRLTKGPGGLLLTVLRDGAPRDPDASTKITISCTAPCALQTVGIDPPSEARPTITITVPETDPVLMRLVESPR
jgi:hypothetical protein